MAMLTKDSTLTQEELKRVLNYNQDTGVFTWKVNRGRLTKIGSIAGTVNQDGYIRISVNQKNYMAHRLAFLYMLEKFPDKEVDHINGISGDNRWINLRECSHAENGRNLKTNKGNQLGIAGIRLLKDKYQARCAIKGKTYSKAFNINVLGEDKALQQAKDWLYEISEIHHKEFSRNHRDN